MNRDPDAQYLCSCIKDIIKEIIPKFHFSPEEFKTPNFLNRIRVVHTRLTFLIAFDFYDFPERDSHTFLTNMINLEFQNEKIFKSDIVSIHPFHIIVIDIIDSLKLFGLDQQLNGI